MCLVFCKDFLTVDGLLVVVLFVGPMVLPWPFDLFQPFQFCFGIEIL